MAVHPTLRCSLPHHWEFLASRRCHGFTVNAFFRILNNTDPNPHPWRVCSLRHPPTKKGSPILALSTVSRPAPWPLLLPNHSLLPPNNAVLIFYEPLGWIISKGYWKARRLYLLVPLPMCLLLHWKVPIHFRDGFFLQKPYTQISSDGLRERCYQLIQTEKESHKI